MCYGGLRCSEAVWVVLPSVIVHGLYDTILLAPVSRKTAAAIRSFKSTFQQGDLCAQGDAFAPPKSDSSGSGSEHGWGPWDQQLLQLYLGPGASVALGLLWIWTLAWPLSDVEEEQEEEGGDTPEAGGRRRGANLEDCVFASMLCCFPESCCMPTVPEPEPEPQTKPG